MEDGRPAADVYWARVTAIDNGRWLGVLAGVASLVTGILPEAWDHGVLRYRVLVGRHDTGGATGVREARTLRTARRQLSEVEQVLADSTAAEARRMLELDS
jgi:hypothetical protein